MASYGTAVYGVDEWGGAYELGAARLLYICRESPNFRALADITDRRWSRMIGILEQIRVAYNLDSAVGVQLDVIGAQLGLERQGMNDARYRRALRVQQLIMASTVNTTASVLAVFEAWITTPAEYYRNVPPAHIEISGPISAADAYLLRRFLRAAAPAGVTLSIAGWAPGTTPLIVDSIAVPVADPGVIDSVASPVADAALIAHEV